MTNTNLSRAKKWLNSAISDINRVLNDLERGDYADIAFRSQFAVEKINKSIFNIFGIKIEKVHNPSTILDDFLKNVENLEIDDKIRSILEELTADSKVFENEGTKTRYGTIERGELITAEEIYNSFEDIKYLLKKLDKIIINLVRFLKYSIKKDKKELEIINELNELRILIAKWI
ncbi:MAG: HEPN domain-containing protein [Promethearchaeia archaeon]